MQQLVSTTYLLTKHSRLFILYLFSALSKKQQKKLAKEAQKSAKRAETVSQVCIFGTVN